MLLCLTFPKASIGHTCQGCQLQRSEKTVQKGQSRPLLKLLPFKSAVIRRKSYPSLLCLLPLVILGLFIVFRVHVIWGLLTNEEHSLIQGMGLNDRYPEYLFHELQNSGETVGEN